MKASILLQKSVLWWKKPGSASSIFQWCRPRRRFEQADEFIRLVKEKSNHPMLINCASANRVGAFMMIYRVERENRAGARRRPSTGGLKIGLRGDELKKFAHSYIAQNQARRG